MSLIRVGIVVFSDGHKKREYLLSIPFCIESCVECFVLSVGGFTQ